jgi:HEAT repeat protein
MPIFGPPDVEKLKTKRDVNGLIKALNHPLINHTCHLNLEAAKALGQLGDPLAVQPLIDNLQRSGFDVMREAAAIALGLIGDAQATQALIRATKDTSPKVRKAAAQALGKIGSTLATEVLINALQDKFPEVQEQALQAIREIGDVRAIKPLAAVYGDSKKYEGKFRVAASQVAQEIATSGKVGAVEVLIFVIQDYDGEARSMARRILVSLGNVVIEPLCALMSSPDSAVRTTAAQALGQIGGIQVIQPLCLALQDSDYQVYATALEALGQIGEIAIDRLVDLLNHTDEAIRIAACTGLIMLGWKPEPTPSGFPYQQELSAAKKDMEQRVHAEISRLLPLIEAEQWSIRRDAAQKLFKLYTTGQITKADQASILKVRKNLVEQHQDGNRHYDRGERPHVDKTTYGECSEHEDHGHEDRDLGHGDTGIGAKFPL